MLVYEVKHRIEKCKAYSDARLVEHDMTLILSSFVSVKTDCSDHISSTSFLIDSHLIISKILLFQLSTQNVLILVHYQTFCCTYALSKTSCRKRKVREIEEQNRPGGNDKWKIRGHHSRKRAKDRRN